MKQRHSRKPSSGGVSPLGDSGTPGTPPAESPSSPRQASTTDGANAIKGDDYGHYGTNAKPSTPLLDFLKLESEGISWILLLVFLGALLGFGVGCGWFTRGPGSYRLTREKRLLAMAFKTGHLSKRWKKHYVISAWRTEFAKKVRRTVLYQIMTFRKAPWTVVLQYCGVGSASDEPEYHWIASSPIWPPNWILFREVDLSQIELIEGGLSPMMVTCLSFILPWRRNLIKALARKDRVKVNLRDVEGNIVEGTQAKTKSFASSILSSPSNPQIVGWYHPSAFSALREYVIRFDHGYVHPDLGFLISAPSGSERGIGMVRDSYNRCQVHCIPGTSEEIINFKVEERLRDEESKTQEALDIELMEELRREIPGLAADVSSSGGELVTSERAREVKSVDPFRNTTTYEGIQRAIELQQAKLSTHPSPFTQEEVLLRIPLEAQITRKNALDILSALLTDEHNKRYLEELDDAFLLTVLLAHERGLGTNSRYWPYIATLPARPTCALGRGWKQSVVDVVTSLAVEMGTDTNGWPMEISKAAEMSERIVAALSRDYKSILAVRDGADDATDNIRWSLCHVASRAIAGRDEHGSLRLVPMMDLINHDEKAEKFYEVQGDESAEQLASTSDNVEELSGAFIVRSTRNGFRKPLRKGQELMANYNVPSYSPLDWFLNMGEFHCHIKLLVSYPLSDLLCVMTPIKGFLPPERSGKWQMLRFESYGMPRSKATGSSTGSPEVQILRRHTYNDASR